MRNLIFIFAILLSAVIIQSCGGSSANCVRESEKSQLVRWGDYNAKTGVMTGYQLNTQMVISRIRKEKNSTNSETHEVGTILPERYCAAISLVKKEILKTQALNLMGDDNYFIEYLNPGMNTSIHVFWNSKIQGNGSEGFRVVFDSLQTLASIGALPIKK